MYKINTVTKLKKLTSHLVDITYKHIKKYLNYPKYYHK